MAEYIERDMFLKIISHKPSIPITDREDRLIDGFISAVKNCPAADVRPVVRGKWIRHDKGWWRLRNGNIATDWHSFLLSAETFKKVCDIESTFSKAETEWKPDYECSVCGSRAWQDEYNYCPNCGADMMEES